MASKGRTALRAASAQNRPVARSTAIPARERRHCIDCGAFLTVHPTHNGAEGFAWWTWECHCCGTYQRAAESGKLVYSS